MSQLKRFSHLNVISLLLICFCSVSAQWQKKPSTEWSNSDIRKVLNDSPWVKKQDILQLQLGQAGYPKGGLNNERSKQGNDPGIKLNNDPSIPTPEKISDTSHTTLYVRLLSAKPLLEAVKQSEVTDEDNRELVGQLKALASSGPGDLIIIAVGLETVASPPRPYGGIPLPLGLSSELINETFLEVKGGQRLPLYAYKASKPYSLRLGGFFIFKRSVEGKPVITPDSNEFHFHTKFPSYRSSKGDAKFIDLDVTYKVKDLVYEGRLEF